MNQIMSQQQPPPSAGDPGLMYAPGGPDTRRSNSPYPNVNPPNNPPQTSSTDVQSIPAMRLRDDPPAVNPAPPRASRKRKTPPSVSTENPAALVPPPNPHQPPPAHMHMPPHMQGHPGPPPMTYQYAPTADYTPGGHPHQPPPPHPEQPQMQPESPSQQSAAGRMLSTSKRAEQNRKAQRAFRERRDQHVKALESRSQLLDAALASADEANRRWEECRALVDQLRIENAALRAALGQAQMMPGPPPAQSTGNGGAAGEARARDESQNEATAAETHDDKD